MLELFFFIIGTIIGSFLNVLIVRVPKDESIVSPPSHCPYCDHRISPLENIPVLSYLYLRGRCRKCGEKISPRYLIVEIITGLLFLMAFSITGLNAKLIPELFIISVLIVVSFIDYELQLIPNKIIYPSIVFSLILILATSGVEALLSSLAGFLIGGGLLLVIVVIQPKGMGLGDVKLAALSGLYLGPKVLISLFLSFLIGAVVSVVLLLLKLKTRKDHIPFGPFIAISAVITLFWGDKLYLTYLNFFGVNL